MNQHCWGSAAMRTMFHFLPLLLLSAISLVFNAVKTQLICFSQKSSTVNLDRVNLVFLDSALTFNSSVTHLGHILRSDLLDDDIIAVTQDCVRKLIASFTHSAVILQLRQTLSGVFAFYGCGLWKISYSGPFTWNNIQRRVWSLPQFGHMGILHQVASLHSLYNTLDRASTMLILLSILLH